MLRRRARGRTRGVSGQEIAPPAGRIVDARGWGSAVRRIGSLAELRAFLREDWQAHDRALLSPGFHALAVYRIGVWSFDLPDSWRKRMLRRLCRFAAFLAASMSGIELHADTVIGRRVRFPHRNVVIHQKARIGDDVLIRQNVTIGVIGSGHDDGAPTIGDRVEFGAGAVAFGPITIGHDVLIGPNVVVSEDVPPQTRLRPSRPERRARSGSRDAPPRPVPVAEI